tara:strand:- start:2078 stop:2335 length:258 start_codon:yes stop_codon:yes gene_type:complete
MTNIFLITSFTKEISNYEVIGIIIGHIIFGIALTQLLDWSWLENLMDKKDKEKMLKSYNWKDLLVDISIISVVLGILFLIISAFI